MKKYSKLAIIFVIMILFSSCTQGLYVDDQKNPDTTNTALYAQKAASASQKQNAVLYFRFNSENYLATDTRTIEVSQGSSFEYDLINALIKGPSSDKIELLQVINPTTKLLSVTTNQEYIYITLSKEFVQAPTWAGNNWVEKPEVAHQVYLYKRLAMYSIINTITESTQYSKVQIYVDVNNAGTIERVTRREMGLIGDGREDQPLEPMNRNADIILSPYNTLNKALNLFIERNLEKNYLYTTDDFQTDTKKPVLADYLYLFNYSTNTLVDFYINPNITISADGQRAVALLNYRIKTSQGISNSTDVPVLLYREKECWKVSYLFFKKNFGGTA